MKIRTLDERPFPSKTILPIYQAFYDLLPEVQHPDGFISWRSVSSYCRDLGISATYMEFMFDVLRYAQAEIQKWVSSLPKSASNKRIV